MKSTAIYSNLSLQVLKIKEIDTFYDEYFNFDVNSTSNLLVCVIMQSLKPIFDEDIFLNFIKRSIANDNKIIIITDNINYINLILGDSLFHTTLFEFPASLFKNNEVSIKNLSKFQFPFGKKLTVRLKTFITNVIKSFHLPKLKIFA